ncbi:MAG: FtsX-like permease family protein, partial [Oscillospiraceae bacterium]|nr:FtsX-like permease family protein [Oscillospiraceae bacterium]
DSLEQMGYVVDELRYFKGVESVSAPTDLARTLTGVEKTLLVLGSIIIGILIVASAVVISNTIRLTLYARRREIRIMKYVGATDAFIRLPFVVEGITIGVISAALAFGVLALIYESLGTMFGGSGISWLTGVSTTLVPFSGLWKWVLGSFLAFGVVLGAFGSGSSIRRYLRV